MSSILKALQRVEENQARPAGSPPRAPQPPPRSRLRLRALLAALALGGLVGLAAAFWWLPGAGPEPEEEEASPAAEDAPPGDPKPKEEDAPATGETETPAADPKPDETAPPATEGASP